MARYRLLGRPAWGSAIVEAQLVALELPFDYEDVGNLFTSEDARRNVMQHNPLPQVPTLLLPDGSVMTESAAITLHLADATGRDDFVPRPDAPQRAQFLRWLVFFVANIYPTFAYADEPKRFGLSDESAANTFRSGVASHLARLWQMVEHEAAAAGGEHGPYFFGERLSAIDVYIATMAHWRPGKQWFDDHTPRVAAIARRIVADPRFGDVWRHNFPNGGAA